MRIPIQLPLAIVLLQSTTSFADEALFNLVCDADKFQSFRADKVNGQSVSHGFSDDGYSNPFTFQFIQQSEDEIRVYIDGEPANPGTALVHADLIYFVDMSANDTAFSSWQYILNLNTGKLVGSQVNGYNSPNVQGLKARTVPFSCVAVSD